MPDSLQAVLAEQQDLMTRAQALEAGMTASALRWAVSRSWQIPLPGVIHVHRVDLRLDQRRIAALLWAGPWAALTGATAAHWYGLRQAEEHGVVRVAVPRRCATRQAAWVRTRRTWVPYDARRAGAMRVVEPARAVVEAAREATDAAGAEALVIEAIQRQLVTLDQLVSVNDQLGRPGSALASRAIAAAADGAWSLPELHLSRLVASSRHLPEMWCNPEVRTANRERLLTPDGWFDDVGLAVMVHSHRYHSGSAWAPTVERDGELAAHGVRVLPVAPSSIAREPARVLAHIERAHRTALATGYRPSVVATRRGA
ncbi:MAG: hypothetical protein Q4G43_02255 [Mobilicoccus sp.]|nr:hypothetical protein [Mobilicoccus sp.]